MTDSRKDWVRLPGEDSESGLVKCVRMGGLVDGEVPDVRSRGYFGIVPFQQAIGSNENWPTSIQDEERRVKSETIYSLGRKKIAGTSDFVPLDDRFWSSLDGKPIMSLGEALDSAHGLNVNALDFSEPDFEQGQSEEELEPEQELEPESETDRIDLQKNIAEWIQERYGAQLEKEIQGFSVQPLTEHKRVSFNQMKLHRPWALKRKKPPQKRRLCCRRARRLHQRLEHMEF